MSERIVSVWPGDRGFLQVAQLLLQALGEELLVEAGGGAWSGMDWLPEAGNAPSGSRVQVDGEGSEQLDGREGKLCREPTTNSHGTADKPPGLIQRYRELLQTRHYARRTVVRRQ